MRPQPTVLFNGGNLMDFAHTTTSNAQTTVEAMSHDQLMAQPVDALIQELYRENEIVLSRLDRDGITQDHFDSYLQVYTQVVPRDRTGRMQINDPTNGTLFAFDVPYIGEKRFFNLKPTTSEPKHPLAYVGENSLTIYIAQRNSSVRDITASFEETVALIETYLQRQFETLRDFPMIFYRQVEMVITARINRFKATRDVVSSMPYPPKPAKPPVAAAAVAPKPAATPVIKQVYQPPTMPTDRNLVLLTGAGFSKNWGGLLASEVFDFLLSAGELDTPTKRMLISANEHGRGGFEAVLGQLQTATDATGMKRRDDLTAALVRVFTDMGRAFERRQFEFAAQPDANTGLTAFLQRFHAIYTTNQDTLIEQKYIPISGPVRQAYLPGLRFTGQTNGLMFESDRAGPMSPDPQNFTLSSSMQPYVKLHGSVNWVDAGHRLLIMGGGKSAIIQTSPLLTWYHQCFRADLFKPNTRLMVMGYSFGDEHLNAVIAEAVEKNRLKMFIVDPAGLAIFDKRDKSAAIPIPKPPEQELLEDAVLGQSRRSITETFDRDTQSNNQLFGFLNR